MSTFISSSATAFAGFLFLNGNGTFTALAVVIGFAGKVVVGKWVLVDSASAMATSSCCCCCFGGVAPSSTSPSSGDDGAVRLAGGASMVSGVAAGRFSTHGIEETTTTTMGVKKEEGMAFARKYMRRGWRAVHFRKREL